MLLACSLVGNRGSAGSRGKEGSELRCCKLSQGWNVIKTCFYQLGHTPTHHVTSPVLSVTRALAWVAGLVPMADGRASTRGNRLIFFSHTDVSVSH